MIDTLDRAMLDCEAKIVKKQNFHHIKSKTRSYKATSNFFNDKFHMRKLELLKKNRNQQSGSSTNQRMDSSPQSPYLNFLL